MSRIMILYRCGLMWTDVNYHRWFITETWDADSQETNSAIVREVTRAIAENLATRFGVTADRRYGSVTGFAFQLKPLHRFVYENHTLIGGLAPVINTSAPEAAVRLQRVGAGSSDDEPIGRICYPILSDAWFLDSPQLRHVDVDTLQGWVNANDAANRYSRLRNGITYRNVIFSRRTNSVTPVTHHVVKPNPIRIWRRWRTYTGPHLYTVPWCPED